MEADPKSLYRDALLSAWSELRELTDQERKIAIRKAQLQETANALFPLVFDMPLVEINTMSLPDAMRIAIRSAGRALSAYDMKTKLTDLGYDLAKFENPLANIQTAMNRLVENDEFIWVEKDAKPKQVLPGPELKSVPDANPNFAAFYGESANSLFNTLFKTTPESQTPPLFEVVDSEPVSDSQGDPVPDAGADIENE
jgi:hypothetical protein